MPKADTSSAGDLLRSPKTIAISEVDGPKCGSSSRFSLARYQQTIKKASNKKTKICCVYFPFLIVGCDSRWRRCCGGGGGEDCRQKRRG